MTTEIEHDKLFDDICQRARTGFVMTGSAVPMLLRVTTDLEIEGKPVELPDDEAKDKVAKEMRDTARREDTLAVAFITEAWGLMGDKSTAETNLKDIAEGKLRVSEHPDKTECLIVQYQSDEHNWTRLAEITRPDDQSVTLGEWEVRSMNSTGRFGDSPFVEKDDHDFVDLGKMMGNTLTSLIDEIHSATDEFIAAAVAKCMFIETAIHALVEESKKSGTHDSDMFLAKTDDMREGARNVIRAALTEIIDRVGNDPVDTDRMAKIVGLIAFDITDQAGEFKDFVDTLGSGDEDEDADTDDRAPRE